MIVLDTDVISQVVRRGGNPHVKERIRSLTFEQTFASSMTLFELRYGAMRLTDGQPLWEKIESLIVPTIQWIPADMEICSKAGDLAAQLHKVGQPIDEADLFIAATALARNLPLATGNVKHYERIPGLLVEDWFGRN